MRKLPVSSLVEEINQCEMKRGNRFSYCEMLTDHATMRQLPGVEKLGFRKVSYLKGKKAVTNHSQL